MDNLSSKDAICRGCLRTDCLLTDKAFDTHRNEWMPHIDKLKYCFIDLTFKDYGVFLLCSFCVNSLQVTYNLKRTIQASEITFNCFKTTSSIAEDDFLGETLPLTSTNGENLFEDDFKRVVVKKEPIEDSFVDVISDNDDYNAEYLSIDCLSFENFEKPTKQTLNSNKKCKNCRKSFANETEQSSHRCSHFEHDLIQDALKVVEKDVLGANQRCKHCNKIFANDLDLSLHLQLDHTNYIDLSPPFKKSIEKKVRRKRNCKFCSIKLKSHDEYVKHMNEKHGSNGEKFMVQQPKPIPMKKIYKCRLCARLFHDITHLKMHETAKHRSEISAASKNKKTESESSTTTKVISPHKTNDTSIANATFSENASNVSGKHNMCFSNTFSPEKNPTRDFNLPVKENAPRYFVPRTGISTYPTNIINTVKPVAPGNNLFSMENLSQNSGNNSGHLPLASTQALFVSPQTGFPPLLFITAPQKNSQLSSVSSTVAQPIPIQRFTVKPNNSLQMLGSLQKCIISPIALPKSFEDSANSLSFQNVKLVQNSSATDMSNVVSNTSTSQSYLHNLLVNIDCAQRNSSELTKSPNVSNSKPDINSNLRGPAKINNFDLSISPISSEEPQPLLTEPHSNEVINPVLDISITKLNNPECSIQTYKLPEVANGTGPSISKANSSLKSPFQNSSNNINTNSSFPETESNLDSNISKVETESEFRIQDENLVTLDPVSGIFSKRQISEISEIPTDILDSSKAKESRLSENESLRIYPHVAKEANKNSNLQSLESAPECVKLVSNLSLEKDSTINSPTDTVISSSNAILNQTTTATDNANRVSKLGESECTASKLEENIPTDKVSNNPPSTIKFSSKKVSKFRGPMKKELLRKAKKSNYTDSSAGISSDCSQQLPSTPRRVLRSTAKVLSNSTITEGLSKIDCHEKDTELLNSEFPSYKRKVYRSKLKVNERNIDEKVSGPIDSLQNASNCDLTLPESGNLDIDKILGDPLRLEMSLENEQVKPNTVKCISKVIENSNPVVETPLKSTNISNCAKINLEYDSPNLCQENGETLNISIDENSISTVGFELDSTENDLLLSNTKIDPLLKQIECPNESGIETSTFDLHGNVLKTCTSLFESNNQIVDSVSSSVCQSSKPNISANELKPSDSRTKNCVTPQLTTKVDNISEINNPVVFNTDFENSEDTTKIGETLLCNKNVEKGNIDSISQTTTSLLPMKAPPESVVSVQNDLNILETERKKYPKRKIKSSISEGVIEAGETTSKRLLKLGSAEKCKMPDLNRYPKRNLTLATLKKESNPITNSKKSGDKIDNLTNGLNLIDAEIKRYPKRNLKMHIHEKESKSCKLPISKLNIATDHENNSDLPDTAVNDSAKVNAAFETCSKESTLYEDVIFKISTPKLDDTTLKIDLKQNLPGKITEKEANSSKTVNSNPSKFSEKNAKSHIIRYPKRSSNAETLVKLSKSITKRSKSVPKITDTKIISKNMIRKIGLSTKCNNIPIEDNNVTTQSKISSSNEITAKISKKNDLISSNQDSLKFTDVEASPIKISNLKELFKCKLTGQSESITPLPIKNPVKNISCANSVKGIKRSSNIRLGNKTVSKKPLKFKSLRKLRLKVDVGISKIINKKPLHKNIKTARELRVKFRRKQQLLHKCLFCFKRFKTKQLVIKHQLSRHKSELGRCRYCESTFKYPSSLRSHEEGHRRPHRCTKCPKNFALASNLQEHEKTHIDSEKHLCKICFKSYKTDSFLKKHTYLHEMSGNGFYETCPSCKQVFQAWKLVEHQKKNKCSLEIPEEDATADAVFFYCPACVRNFQNLEELQAHVKIHFYLKCSACNKCCKTFPVMEKHLSKMHQNVKRPISVNMIVKKHLKMELAAKRKRLQKLIKCKLCNKQIMHKVQLKYHLFSHITKRKQKCRLCNKKYFCKGHSLSHKTRGKKLNAFRK